MPAGFQNAEVASSAMAQNAPPMPTARAPTGIFMNSPAYLVAAAGAATSARRNAANSTRFGWILMRLLRFGPLWKRGRKSLARRRSTVDRTLLRLPLRHARFADGLRDTPFPALADQLVP